MICTIFFLFLTLIFSSVEITPKEWNHLAKGIKSLKRKGSSVKKISKKARTDEPTQIMPISIVPIFESDMATSALILPREDTATIPLEQCEVIKKKKNKRMPLEKRRGGWSRV